MGVLFASETGLHDVCELHQLFLLLSEVIPHFVDGQTEATELKNLDVRLTVAEQGFSSKLNLSLKPQLKSIPLELFLQDAFINPFAQKKWPQIDKTELRWMWACLGPTW